MTTDYPPMHQAPVSVRAPFDVRRPVIYDPSGSRLDRRNALTEALTGIELGEYDQRMLDWLAGWDIPTVGTIVSLLYRVRAAGGAR
jgi:hypothetical protein